MALAGPSASRARSRSPCCPSPPHPAGTCAFLRRGLHALSSRTRTQADVGYKNHCDLINSEVFLCSFLTVRPRARGACGCTCWPPGELTSCCVS